MEMSLIEFDLQMEMSSISTPLIHNLSNRFDLHTDDRRHLLLPSPWSSDQTAASIPEHIYLAPPSSDPIKLPPPFLSCRPPISSIYLAPPSSDRFPSAPPSSDLQPPLLITTAFIRSVTGFTT
ncbi:hypothetical protein L2E82_37955 [Cichorium intybus]|uniref:Uncharacterized protein n=1 Tax=Cichorium intybus TaxID=13427 RepID=A0ACB9AG72_CICIN|nr:hypothetical protein L2E82_37955 [Cichorium intybus]